MSDNQAERLNEVSDDAIRELGRRRFSEVSSLVSRTLNVVPDLPEQPKPAEVEAPFIVAAEVVPITPATPETPVDDGIDNARHLVEEALRAA